MADVYTRTRRAEIMSRIRGRDTKPELLLLSLLKGLGLKARCHVKTLPGSPEFVLPRESIVLFVHGCFWHGHDDCSRAALPTSNRAFWKTKIRNNRKRDRLQLRALRAMGWSVGIFWTCRKIGEYGLRIKLRRLGLQICLTSRPRHPNSMPKTRRRQFKL